VDKTSIIHLVLLLRISLSENSLWSNLVLCAFYVDGIEWFAQCGKH